MDAFYCEQDLVSDVGCVKPDDDLVCQFEASFKSLEPTFNQAVWALWEVGVIAWEFDMDLGAWAKFGLRREFKRVVRNNQHICWEERNFVAQDHTWGIRACKRESDKVEALIYDIALQLGYNVELLVCSS